MDRVKRRCKNTLSSIKQIKLNAYRVWVCLEYDKHNIVKYTKLSLWSGFIVLVNDQNLKYILTVRKMFKNTSHI